MMTRTARVTLALLSGAYLAMLAWGVLSGVVAHNLSTVAGCETDRGTGFCAPLDGPALLRWDHGPGGTSLGVGVVTVTRYSGPSNAGWVVDAARVGCAGVETRGAPGVFHGGTHADVCG